MPTNRERRRIEQAATRHGRRKTGLSLCEGVRCCREALRRRPDWIERVIVSEAVTDNRDIVALTEMCRHADLPEETIAPAEFAALSATDNPQGILCLLRPGPPRPPEPSARDPFVLILDGLGEPGNVGTILRTAWAAGLREVWLTRQTADPYAPKTIRAGMGAQFALECRWINDLADARDALRQRGFARLWLGIPSGGVSCYGSEFDLAGSGLVVGSEAHGVSRHLADAGRVTIPMPGGADSLNAAQAATVLILEGVRRGILT